MSTSPTPIPPPSPYASPRAQEQSEFAQRPLGRGWPFTKPDDDADEFAVEPVDLDELVPLPRWLGRDPNPEAELRIARVGFAALLLPGAWLAVLVYLGAW